MGIIRDIQMRTTKYVLSYIFLFFLFITCALINSQTGIRSNTSYIEEAVNILDGSVHFHHPALTKLPQKLYPVEDGYITEMNGLKVPNNFDCDPFNKGAPWGSHPYYVAIAPRWQQCHLHIAHMRSGEPAYKPELPVIDEEYFEMVATYDTVHKAKSKLVVAEIGARWGTWGARALALWRRKERIKASNYDLLFVESSKVHCNGLKQVMDKNEINYTLHCENADPGKFVKWAQSMPHIDLMHVDIQGAEVPFLSDKNVWKVMHQKVKRVVLGTHSVAIHHQMSQMFNSGSWIKVHELERMDDHLLNCAMNTFRSRRNGHIDRSNFNSIIARGCYRETVYGKIAVIDGEFILDNPKFNRRGSLTFL